MTRDERIEWDIANAAAIMKVSREEAAKRLDATLGPEWRNEITDEQLKQEPVEIKAYPAPQQ